MTTTRAFVLLSLLSVGFAASSCKALQRKEGDACTRKFDVTCVGDTGGLICDGSRMVAVVCRGPLGCHLSGAYKCDQSLAKAGDACLIATDATCGDDKKSMLKCTNSKWALRSSCGGDKGCNITGDKVMCDSTLANAGDACDHADSHSCTSDKTGHTVCHGSKVELVERCRGTRGCNVEGDNIVCDRSVAMVGEPCDKDGSYACSSDTKSLVKCKGRKYVTDEICKKGKSCHVTGTQVSCG